MNVRQAYKMYYRMKTTFLSQTLTDVLEEDDEDSFDSSSLSHAGSSLNISAAISDLLDPHKSLALIQDDPRHSNWVKPAKNSQEFEAAEELSCNENAWNEDLNKRRPKEKPKEQNTFKKKISLTIEPTMMKPLRNPKKSLSKLKLSSSNNFNSIDGSKEVLPDLETILLEKSRSSILQETKKTSTTTNSEIKTSIDIGWLDRNTSLMDAEDLVATASTLSSTSSFGLSNLNMKSFTSSTSLNCPSLSAEVKFHTLDTSDHEIVGNSDDELEAGRPLLHIAKKRRLTTETLPKPTMIEPDHELTVNSSQLPVTAAKDVPDLRNKIPEKPKRLSVKKPTVKTNLETVAEDLIIDKPPADSTLKPSPDDAEPVEASPPVMQRKRSVIKRSKDGISKITKKATKLLTRGKKETKENEDDDDATEKPEAEINFLIDSDLNAMTTVPRASQKELRTTKKLFDNYMLQHDKPTTSNAKIIKVVDAKTAAKKEALEKKVASGSLNENYVRVNLKKKIFVRGKKAFSFSKYKKGVWKSKKAAALSGENMDMRGCDGGVLKCFNCGGVGHFAQNCKQKGDSLLPADAEVKDESPFPTLEEAAQMASDQKLLVHSNKPDTVPLTSNEIWKRLNESSDEEVEAVGDNKENKDGNTEAKDIAAEPPQKVKLKRFFSQDQ